MIDEDLTHEEKLKSKSEQCGWTLNNVVLALCRNLYITTIVNINEYFALFQAQVERNIAKHLQCYLLIGL